MFAITGITGQVGGHLARRLLAQGQPVRAVLRHATKAAAWADRGCDIAIADIDDRGALQAAFDAVEGAFVVLPPCFDPTPGFVEAARSIESIRSALLAAAPPRVVVLSTIGAQATQANLLNQLGLLESRLRTLPMPVTCLRAAWFMENIASDLESARTRGVIDSALQPGDKPVPMVATVDIAEVAARLLQSPAPHEPVVELEGPCRITPHRIAESLGRALGRVVVDHPIERGQWEQRFRQQGMLNPLPRMQMLDGFNQGWIEFEGTPQRGTTTFDQVLAELLRGPG